MDRRTGVQAALFCTEHALLATLITKLACTRELTVSANAAARAYRTTDTNSYVDTDYDLAEKMRQDR